MRINSKFVLKELSDEYLAIPVDSEANIFKGLVILNEPSFMLLRTLQNRPLSLNDFISLLTDQYLVDLETAAADLEVLIHDLMEMGLIEA